VSASASGNAAPARPGVPDFPDLADLSDRPQAPDEVASICATLGLAPSASQQRALHQYLNLLQRWNATYNLTAVRDRQAMLSHHLADCLAMVPAVQAWLAQRVAATGGQAAAADADADAPGHQAAAATPTTAKSAAVRMLDVGSGGGLPGVVLAVMLPRCEVTCVDTVGKKSAFVRQVAATLPLSNLHALHARVEAIQGRKFQLVTSRAFATLADFVALSRGCLAPGGHWLAMKGKTPHDEMALLPADVEVFHVEQLQVPGLAAQRCLVWMRPKKLG
jgi:16S rRNA (guanine527-N7)-methyltransferase